MFPVLYMHIFFLLMLSNTSSGRLGRNSCSTKRTVAASIGAVIDRTTRVGREQEIAMDIAVQDVYRDSCIQLTLHLREVSVLSTKSALELINHEKFHAFVGALSLPGAADLSESTKNISDIPVFLLPPTPVPRLFLPTLPPNLLLMANNFSCHMQCLAAIIEHFQWQRVTLIYEQSSGFSMDSATISVLSDSLKSVDATIANHIAFPSLIYSSDPEIAIEKELHKLRSGSNRIFVVLHLSLKFGTYLFRKADQMGMVGKGFVWIVSDEIASLLSSVDSSISASMQGVIGYKTNYISTSKSYRDFKVKFQKRYLAKYPNDLGNPTPSLFALRAYDAVQLIGKAKNDAVRQLNSKALLPNILSGKFAGLSGIVSFQNGELEEPPTFQIINVVGNGYKELALWSPGIGFSEAITKESDRMEHMNAENNLLVELGPIYWPGGQQVTPRGWTSGASYEKPLRIGVPASGCFHQFVNVTFDEVQNQTFVTGFVVDVFNASLKYLPYDLHHDLVPFYGAYDDLVHGVKKKAFDAVIGDINILERRYKWADFTQPFVNSGMDMIVTAKKDRTKEMWIFMVVFERKVWIIVPSLGLFIGFVVWLIERDNNPEFGDGPLSQQIGTIIWFPYTVLFFAQKESPKSNWSKIVLGPWYFLALMLTIYFTAALTSLMTVSELLPSVTDVETLRRENAVVGCNWNSFVCSYLVEVLHFKPENIKHMRSIDEYPPAFQAGEIKAAFLITSHAKVFLAKYCNGYTLARPTFNFGGLGFAFRKGSELAVDMSQAILKATEAGEIEALQHEMLSRSNCSTSTIKNNSTTVGLEPLSGLLFISGSTAAVVLLIKVVGSVEQRLKIAGVLQERMVRQMEALVAVIIHKIRSEPSTLPITRNSSSETTIEMHQSVLTVLQML